MICLGWYVYVYVYVTFNNKMHTSVVLAYSAKVDFMLVCQISHERRFTTILS